MVSKRVFFQLLVFKFLQIEHCENAQILGLFTDPFPSHSIIFSSITYALAERGHNITVVTTVPLIKKHQTYRHIQLDCCSIPEGYFTKKIYESQPYYKQFQSFLEILTNCSNLVLQQPAMKILMAEEHFDLVILGYWMNDFLLGVAAHFKCPVVVALSIQPIRLINQLIGNPSEVAYVPHFLSHFGFGEPMTFWERLMNFLGSEIFEPIVMWLYMEDQQKQYYEYHFPSYKYPSFEEVKKNISLVLTNHHFSQGPIRPNVPGLVEIGGIQIKEKPDPLPEDIKSILENSKHGIIYLSFGSGIQGDALDRSKTKIMFDVLSKLPQTILWKWGKTDPPDNAPNIIYKTWMPQDDILANSNVKLFITHGGQGSIVESQYHGVPMVGVPLFGDQHVNMMNVQKKGYGRSVDFASLTEKSFGDAITDVLSNNKYRHNVQQFAKLYKDRPMSAKETAAFWIEYVMRHHGAPHLQSPALHLNKFQLMSLDVIGFLLLSIYLWLWAFKYCVHFICLKCFLKPKNKKD